MKFSRVVERIGMWLDYIAGLCLVTTMVLIIVNILLRVVWHKPLLGVMEYVNILTALTIGLALAYCAFRGGHIAVDYVVEKMPERSRAITDLITNIAALLFWAVATYYMAAYGRSMMITGLVTSTTDIPMYPVPYLIAMGLGALCLVLIHRISISLKEVLT